MDYLKCGGDVKKYSEIASHLVLGSHREQPVRFSIMIPTYRRVRYLREAIQSALNQRYTEPYEIIIVDNNDEDDEMFKKVSMLVSSFHDDRIVYYRNEKNIGIYGNTLRAGQVARGERLILLNDDDILHPMYLQVINGFIEKYHYAGVIGTIPAEFRGNRYQFLRCQNVIRSYSISKIEFFFGCTVTSPGLCIPRTIYEEIYNAYDGLLMGDQILQYKALKKYGLVFIDSPLALYRVDSNATLKEDILLDMTIHMCRFRYQTATDSLLLKAYRTIFWKYYTNWYINETADFWKIRSVRPYALKALNVEDISRNHFWYQFNVWLISCIRRYYSKYRLTHCDIIQKGLDY